MNTRSQEKPTTVPWQDYQASRTEWFRTPEAFRWFKRIHEVELTRAGALMVIMGRVFVSTEEFDACVIEIGRRLATSRAAEVA